MTDKLIVPKEDPKFSDNSCGVVVSMSHDTFIEMLKLTGYLRESDTVVGLKIDEHRTSFYLK